ncbi:MAG: C25 family cysteine peptidase [Chitinophagaceae bacterium]
MKKFFTLLLLLAGLTGFSQQYYNEWIRPGQTYYKFKVGRSGLYRISKAVLNTAGIGNTPVQNLELWRNGQRVPFYPTVSSGALPTGGYLEFWGQINDGLPDAPLYRDPAYQHTNKMSLINDTTMYYLSVNTNQSGFLISDITNNVAGSSLTPEPYFMYTMNNFYRTRINLGFASIVSEYIYSSSYDKGEYYSSAETRPATPLSTTINNLYPYSGGPTPTMTFGASGNVRNERNIRVTVNNTVVKDTIMNYFNDLKTGVQLTGGILSSGSVTAVFTNTSAISTDRMVVSYFDITYPRLFNFNNQSSFEFTLPAKPAGYMLHITNFNYGAVAPVLYDISSGQRYVGDISTAGTVKFALPGSTSARNLVLVSEETSNVTDITDLASKTFVNYTQAANQGEYIIISNPALYTGSSGNNPVEDYKAYRQSAQGGSHKVVIVDVNDLIDQFGYGIKKNPIAVKNFLRFARANYAIQPKFVLLIGRGMTYVDYHNNEANALTDRLNLVPTFGYPGSDNMLSSDDGASPIAITPIGRLSVVEGKEIEVYLDKLKEYESVQQTAPNTIDGRAWTKNVAHVTGSSDIYLGTILCNYMSVYRQIIEDTAFGGKVQMFCKTSTNPAEMMNGERLSSLFNEGMSFLTYFGHSSSTTLEFDIDKPESYANEGKYPVFFVNGCNAGNFFTYYAQRFSVNETLSEKFVLSPKHGAIAFVASTHYGVVSYLNVYLNSLYYEIGQIDYGKTLGETCRDALTRMLNVAGSTDYYARIHAEQISLHGDPALYINGQPKPDYVIEKSSIKISPSFISIAESSFKANIKMVNIGRSINDSIVLEVKRQYPDGTEGIIYRDKIKGVRNTDSITLSIPIVPLRDKGLNKITVTIDADMKVDEMVESNNSATQEFYIYEDEANPVYPYEYAIINDPTQKLYASTANPLGSSRSYIMEMDTTTAFNSPMKLSKTLTSTGGVLEFTPGIVYQDSTVYYWRTATVQTTGDMQWNVSSFTYIPNTEGVNQSHYFQHLNSVTEDLALKDNRTWTFNTTVNNVFVRNAVYPTAATLQSAFMISVNGLDYIGPGCDYDELIFNVIDPISFKPWKNDYSVPGTGAYHSKANCGTSRDYGFTYSLTTATTRKYAMDFLNMIPDGFYIIARTNTNPAFASNTFIDKWKADTSTLGPGNSLYHTIYNMGGYAVDQFTRSKALSFVFKKGDPSFTKYAISDSIYDKINLSVDCLTPDTIGYITSPKFGPAKSWRTVKWGGTSLESPSTDHVSVDVIGIDAENTPTTLFTMDGNTRELDISSVDANQYPFMQLEMRVADSVKATPFQLQKWRILYSPAPEGAVAHNLYFEAKDTLDIGEPLKFGVAFKNVSKIAFADSIVMKAYIVNRNNQQTTINLPKQKPLISGDTVKLNFIIDTKDYVEDNTLYVEFNPEKNQPEQYHFNNFLYRPFYVRPDKTSPVMDVTFDGQHILNRDIVSSRPIIQVKIKDEAKYMLLNDTSISSVDVKYPDGNTRTYYFDNDTLRFIPATSGANNTASIEFRPAFTKQFNPDEDEYELIVRGKDRSNNKAGQLEYRIAFRVITKPMISNVLNYPNPFSTSTAFVFTITGSEVPSNIKIQILTVTGKIVKEITKGELGPLHIGRNITEYKWDGTDQYGQKLGNGVYLYRVVTTLNGKSMDKYKSEDDNTDKYFTNGYGKMYLMR